MYFLLVVAVAICFLYYFSIIPGHIAIPFLGLSALYMITDHTKYNIELPNSDLVTVNTIWFNSNVKKELNNIKPSWWIKSSLPVIPSSSITPKSLKYIKKYYDKIIV